VVFNLAVAVSVGVLGLTSLGLLVLRATRPASLSELLTVLVVAALAGFGALAMARMTDDAVAVYGETTFCQNAEFDDQPSGEVQDRCTAQRNDRARQAWLAAAGASLLAAGATCLVTAVGPLARRRDPDARPVVPPIGRDVKDPSVS
jgi:hypothetical protein